MMCAAIIYTLYQSWRGLGNERSTFIESRIPIDGLAKVEPGLGNDEQSLYVEFLSGECLIFLNGLIEEAIYELSIREEFGDEILLFMTFIHEIFATAMWKYGLALPNDFENFVREYDRLDTNSVRRRLLDALRKNHISFRMQK